MVSKKGVPLGIKIISILDLIAGILIILVCLLYLLLGILIYIYPEQFFDPSDPSLNYILPYVFGIVIIFLLFGILKIFIARGLWKAKPWARNTDIIISVIGILITVVYSFYNKNIIDLNSFYSITIHTVILFYLIFSKEVKSYFS